jgi:hypothetical protein
MPDVARRQPVQRDAGDVGEQLAADQVRVLGGGAATLEDGALVVVKIVSKSASWGPPFGQDVPVDL